ncbi:flagellar hook-associated protein FlgK [Dongia rigui]|uniref:Flagellar hook-associated protein 1 n=1 Tax=Dongia rigui TaxID=940149 RepID=A0ABU5DT91_9PROT|nr:flagellar hook-associated protein FlgK [Dongia rigui]MDY0870555.1 flagellar hook-associated protein FlgK [Dongia rigui]
MSLTGALNAAVASLRVNQASISVLSANIAHVNDPNYTKKTLNRESIVLGDSQVGSVAVAGYSTAVSENLRKQMETLIAGSGTSGAQNELMSRVQQLLGTSTDQAALPSLLSQFTAAWQTLQATPESKSAQTAVIRYGQQLTEEVNRVAAGIDSLDSEVKDETTQSVDALNGLLEQVFELNVRLRSASENGAERADLIDQRDNLVRQVAQYVDVRTVERENGAIALFTPAGLSLVDGPPSNFTFDGTNIFRAEDPKTPIESLFREGKIRALVDFRLDNSSKAVPVSTDPATEVLRKLRSQLDQVAKAMTSTTGSTFSSAYDAAGQSLRVVMSFQTTVAAQPASPQYTTVGLTGDLRPGDVFEIDINGRTFSYTAQANDATLDAIAGKLAGLINGDTTLGVTAVAGAGAIQLSGTANDTPYSVKTLANGEPPELKSGFFIGSDRFTFAVNESLLDGTQQLKKNSASDVVTALNSTDRTFVAAGLTVSGVSYKGMMINIVGTSVANAKSIADQAKFDSESLKQTEQRYQADVGVNLDEELANLQVLQNAYAASARLLTVVQQLFDTLQAAVSR